MTFGYDARIRGSTLNSFQDSAQLLLKHLEIARHYLKVSPHMSLSDVLVLSTDKFAQG